MNWNSLRLDAISRYIPVAPRIAPIVPLGRDASSRYLPWVFALMVYLAVLASAAALLMHSAAERWSRGDVRNLTIQILPLDDGSDDARAEQALEVLLDIPGVTDARLITRSENVALLEPWLGVGNVPSDLPLPQLIDVTVDSSSAPEAETIAERLQALGPGVSVDDPKLWLGRVASFSQSLEAVAAAVVILIALAATATVIFTTRMGLAIHQGVIELLHLMGAQDSYVAQQFQNQALSLGLRGGLIGGVAGIGTLIGLQQAAGGLDLPLAPNLSVAPWAWVLLLVVPVVIALIAMLTARFTALRALARMP